MIAGSDTANGSRQRADRKSGLLGEPRQQCPPRRVGKRGEGAVEGRRIKLNHVVKYRQAGRAVKRTRTHCG